jgi:Uma2 family endonuclease
MPSLPAESWFELAPDWICEVPPSTAIIVRTQKQEIYRQQGIPWLCFVDTAAHTIEVLQNAESGWFLAGTFGGKVEARMPPFDAVPIDIESLWDLGAPQG